MGVILVNEILITRTLLALSFFNLKYIIFIGFIYISSTHRVFFKTNFKHLIILKRSPTWKCLFSLSTQFSGRLHWFENFNSLLVVYEFNLLVIIQIFLEDE